MWWSTMVMGISIWINLAGRPEGLLSDSEKMESRARRRWGIMMVLAFRAVWIEIRASGPAESFRGPDAL